MKARVFALTVVFLSCGVLARADPPEFVLEWGSNGAGNGQFGGAHGIEVDANGNVYVADTGNNRIQKFTSMYRGVEGCVIDPHRTHSRRGRLHQL